MKIVNDDSRVVNKFETSPTDDARIVIYDCHMFIVQAIGAVLGFPPNPALLANNRKYSEVEVADSKLLQYKLQ